MTNEMQQDTSETVQRGSGGAPLLSVLTPECRSPRNARVVSLGALSILFSFDNPVAFSVAGDGQIYITRRRYSITTDRHVEDWLDYFSSGSKVGTAAAEEYLNPDAFNDRLQQAIVAAAASVALG